MTHWEVEVCDGRQALGKLGERRAQLVYLDPPYFSGKARRRKGGAHAFGDAWPDLDAYLAFLRELVDAGIGALTPRGVIVLHLDWRASHHGRLLLEQALGARRFLNEIIWAYRTGGLSRRWLARKHDTLAVFARGPGHTFNLRREKSYLAHAYGFRNVAIQRDERGPYTLAALRDVWEVPALRGNNHEDCGYPTQKPLALLRRLIECFSQPGDLVADLCCGSGTTLVAAVSAGRHAWGCDVAPQAVDLARSRLRALGAD